MSVSDDATKALVLDAMMKSLDQAKRDELIRRALEALVTPQHVHGSRRNSALEDAFQYAINGMAREIVREMLEQDDVKQRVREIVAKAFEKFTTDGDRIATAMANAFVTAMTSER